MSRIARLAVVFAGGALLLVTAAPAHEVSGGLTSLERAAKAVSGQAPAAQSAVKALNVEVVAHHDLGGGGLNADVYSFGKFAYVGVWGGPPCPATGVKVVDIAKPSSPVLAGVLQNPSGTSAEDVVVVRAHTASFNGDLAVVGIQACAPGGVDGLQLFDVTDPYRPLLLGFWASPAFGCHELDATVRERTVVVACAAAFSGAIGADELYLVDASNPSSPTTAGSFGGLPTFGEGIGFGCFPAQFAHSARFADNGRTLYVSYWDAGVLNLDVSDPSAPTVVGTTPIGDEDGDFHSVALGRGGNLLFVNPEDFSPVDEGVFCEGDFGGWGDLQIYDNSDPRNPRLLSTFATENANSKRTDGFYSVHNTEVFRGNLLASAWYSDGIRLIDVTNPASPTEVGVFVPPATEDPHGFFPTVPLVWGVWPHDGKLILASDINSGLWILRPTGGGGATAPGRGR